MKEIEIKGGELTEIVDLHDFLRKELNLPIHYGENLDALWDCIVGEIDLPISVLWFDYLKSRELMGELADKYLALFEDAAKKVNGFDFKVIPQHKSE